MSRFARPPRYAPDDARAYVQAIRARVGDDDPLALLGAAPARFADAVSGLSDANARRQPDADQWSVIQVLRHLSDCELVYGYRMRLIAAEDRPAIPGFDQEAWAERLHYAEGTVADALADVSAQRAMTLRWLATLSEGELARVGVHAERGQESVEDIVTLLAGHDLVHLDQIARVRGELGV